ncbi:thioredoxin domain-containing protein [Pyrobaculum neutrophilum]|uniref:Thioredoxin domain-containing protein n=1 Tax=Pyrobaculum neutrophilum (strain DSM 2338 / JCM 9278 / NBRC 100436 / V24Sta) TaxID=444157 RepID=B1Y9M8_PYRNV|nr:thioredoxin domain-containing protein [Pyrobaculum neutrophilum]ACB40457.1 conserved hypothetical protein [Pyrobaculum neutrophilum V24Sta]
MRIGALLLLATAAFVLIAALYTYKILASPPPPKPASGAIPIPSWAISVGSPEAPVVLVELFDLHCPYCAEAHEVLDPLYRRLLAEGRLRIVFVDFIVHPDAVLAHRYLHCAYQQLGNKTYDLITDLYKAYIDGGPDKQLQLLTRYQCPNAPTQKDFDAVAKAMAKALAQMGITQLGTPTFIVIRNGTVNVVVGKYPDKVAALIS